MTALSARSETSSGFSEPVDRQEPVAHDVDTVRDLESVEVAGADRLADRERRPPTKGRAAVEPRARRSAAAIAGGCWGIPAAGWLTSFTYEPPPTSSGPATRRFCTPAPKVIEFSPTAELQQTLAVVERSMEAVG